MSADDAVASVAPPRLRIVHLLGWTAGCALGFAAYHRSHGPFNPQFRAVGEAYDLVMGAAFGTFLSGSILLAVRRLRGGAIAEDIPPGRYLLAFGLASAAANGLAIAAYLGVAHFVYEFRSDQGAYGGAYLAIFQMSWAPEFLHPIHQTAGWGAGALAAIAFGLILRRRLRGPWPAVFLAFGAAAGVLWAGATWALLALYVGGDSAPTLAWGWWARHVYAACLSACVLVLLAAVAWDAVHRRRTDGLHWAGVGAWLAIAAIQLVVYAMFRR